MKIFSKLISVLLCCAMAVGLMAQNYEYEPGQLIVKFKADKSAIHKSAFKNQMGGRKVKELKHMNVELFEVEGNVRQLIEEYRSHPDVEYIQPNYIYTEDITIPNDPLFGNLWGMNNTGQFGGTPDVDIDAPEAWDIATGSPSIVVGVIDTGIDWGHEDLVDNIWQNLAEDADGDGQVIEWNGVRWVFDPGDQNGIDDDGNGYVDDFVGWDFRNNDNDPYDDRYHGTHVAGTVGARGGNGIGVTGTTWDVQLAGLKFLGSNGRGNGVDAAEAVNYAVAMGMPLTNNSWGGGPYEQLLVDALQNAEDNGHIFVASSGNDSNNNDINVVYPASYTFDNIISVANTTRTDALFARSNYGANSVDLAAPGTTVRSCLPFDEYGDLTGTSMAAPHVVGACALLWERHPEKTAAEIKEAILNSVDVIPAMSGKCLSNGRLNLYNALTYFENPPPSGCRYTDSLALVATYTAANGANWNNVWNLNQPINTWYGVTLNADGCVTILNLSNNNLTGSYPGSLNILESLVELDLSDNQLSGTLPSTISNLENLTTLKLPGNQFSGSFPQSLLALTNLTTLHIFNNNFTGCYQAELADLCTRLNSTNADISDGNNFDTPWETFCTTQVGSCSYNTCRYRDSLALVALYNSAGGPNWNNTWNLNAEIDTWHGVNVGSSDCVVSLNLSYNNLIGTLPPEIGDLSELYNLTMNDNNLTGSLPDELGNLTKLRDLHFYRNNLTGTLPASIGNISGLQKISVYANNLTGSIPTSYGNLSNLRLLNLFENNLSGCYDANLMNLCSTLSDNYNVNFHISNGNNFDVPWETFCNNGTGTCGAPVSCRYRDSLALVALYNAADGPNWTNTWDLSQPTDTWYGVTISSSTDCVVWLKLDNNQLNGTLPSEIGDLTSLSFLWLNNNNLTGNLPLEIGNLTNLRDLYLYSNNMTGDLPSSLGNLDKLRYFSIYGNNFTGSLLPQMGNWSDLRMLNIFNNNFSGCYPANLSNLCNSLQSTYNENFYISNGNNFDAEWEDFCNIGIGTCGEELACSVRDSLALVALYNATNGVDWIDPWDLTQPMHTWNGVETNEEGCVILVSRINKQLNGTIPPEIGDLRDLEYLALPENQLTGSLPPEIGQLNELIQLYLYYNQLEGEIPYEMGNMTKLKRCGMHVNNFSGGIPPSIGNLQGLTVFTVHSNNLSGCYPANLSNLCGQLISPPNLISNSNNLDASWEDFCATGLGICSGATWPGDFNNDGTANTNDMLYWGLANNNTGPARTNETTNWTPQDASEWQIMINGVNGKHQDADGNGIVNAQDLQALTDNHGRVHSFTPPTATISPYQFRIEQSSVSISGSNTIIEYTLYLETDGQPVTAHGATCTIDFRSLPLSEANVDIVGSSLEPQEYMGIFDSPTNILHLAFTRTDRNNQLLSGPIAIIQAIVVTNDVPTDDVFNIDLQNGSMMTAEEEISSVSGTSLYALWQGTSANNSDINATVGVIHEQCGALGEASVQASGGTAPYTYTWSNGATISQINNLTEGTYTVTVNDASDASTILDIQVEGHYIPVYDENGDLVDCSLAAPQVKAQLCLALEGAYDTTTGLMSSSFKQLNLLPNRQPYHIAPWSYDGTEGSNLTSDDYPAATVDWVLVSFRTTEATDTEIGQTAAVLTEDGCLQFTSEYIPLTASADSIYVVVEHRNHIAVMTPQAIPIIDNLLTYDFRDADSYKKSTSFGQKQLTDGTWTMIVGDCDQTDSNGYDITGEDKSIWSNANGTFGGYFLSDLNLDGDVNGADKGLWFENNGVSSVVPK